MARKILLVTTVSWPSVPRYAAGFAAAGCEVHAFAPSNAPVVASRYVFKHHLYEAFTPIRSLRQAVEASGCDLLVACDDRAVTVLLQFAEADSGRFHALVERSLGALPKYPEMISRNDSLAAMHAAGVRVPETFAVSNEDDLDQALSQIRYPAVLKADGSWGGEGVIIARDREAAFAALRKLSQPTSRLRNVARAMRRRDSHFLLEALSPAHPAISVQRFVPGTSSASAFAAWSGKIVGEIYYDILVADGVVGPPNVIRRVQDADMAFAARAAAERFSLSGLHGMDFIRDADGKVHLIEINPRGTQGGTLAFGPGADLPADLTAAAFGTITGMRPAIVSDTVVMFPREWLRDATSEWLARGHHDVPWDDPAVFRLAVSGKR